MGLRVPIWKMNFCSRVLRLFELPKCKERPQIAICCLEWLGKLKFRCALVTGCRKFSIVQKTCPFIHNAKKISGPKRSIKITDHFTCTSANVIYCLTCTYCKKIYIGETGRRLGDRFREHLRDVERNDKDASKPVARHFNLRNHSKQHMAICGLSVHLGSSESRKTLQ